MRIAGLIISLVLSLTTGCGQPDSSESQVRKTIAAIEAAAEDRDVGDVMDSISPEFRSPYGQNPDELRQYLYGLFIANQSIHLLTRINTLEFPAPDEARVNVTVGMASREAESANAWNLAAEVHEFDLTLRKEGPAWKVIYAEHKPR